MTVVGVSSPPPPPHLHLPGTVHVKAGPSLGLPSLYRTLLDCQIVDLTQVRLYRPPETDCIKIIITS